MLFEQGTCKRPVQRTGPLTGPLGRREHVDTHGLMGLAADADDNESSTATLSQGCGWPIHADSTSLAQL